MTKKVIALFDVDGTLTVPRKVCLTSGAVTDLWHNTRALSAAASSASSALCRRLRIRRHLTSCRNFGRCEQQYEHSNVALRQ